MQLSSGLRQAIKQAKRSTHDKARVGAVAFRGHCAVSHGFNRRSSRTPDYAAHAERIALSNAGYAADSLTVARVGKSGLVFDSVPCGTCLNLLRLCNVKKLEYVLDGKRVVVKL